MSSVGERDTTHDQSGEPAGASAQTPPGAGLASDPAALARVVEALVLSAERPIGAARVAAALGLEEKGAAALVRQCVDTLNQQYEQSGRAFRIEQVAGGFKAMMLPEFAPQLAALHGVRESQSLSKAAVETLAIIAYRQPVTRASLEAIRGVACGEVLRALIERRLVDVAGRAEEPGRPMLYGTTKRFLEVFGLGSLKDLPVPGGDSLALGALDRSAAPSPNDSSAGEMAEQGGGGASVTTVRPSGTMNLLQESH
jgi:segregation and condensation protein B